MIHDILENKKAINGISVLVEEDISDVERLLLDDDGKLIPVHASELSEVSQNKLRIFCLTHGIYSVPTFELIDEIRSLVPNLEKSIQIGAGNGVYGRALGIKMTDNFMQSPKNSKKFKGVIESYLLAGQPLVKYGSDVLEIDGNEAVKRFKPETVFMSWVTHKWKPENHHLGGNMFGVDMEALLNRKHIKRIILVGNKQVHESSPLMNHPHEEIELPNFIFSRATDKTLDRLYVWNLNHD